MEQVQVKEKHQVWLPNYEYQILKGFAENYNVPITQLLPALILTLNDDDETIRKTLNNMFKY
jgi:hypothetical protein